MSEITIAQGNLTERKHSTQCKKIVISNIVIKRIIFDLVTDEGNIDFNISGISDEAVKRSETFNYSSINSENHTSPTTTSCSE